MKIHADNVIIDIERFTREQLISILDQIPYSVIEEHLKLRKQTINDMAKYLPRDETK